MSRRAPSPAAQAALLAGWYSPSVLAELRLPVLPSTARNINDMAERKNWRAPASEYPANEYGLWRKRQGRGGGFEYRAAVLPIEAAAALTILEKRAQGRAAMDANPETTKAGLAVAARGTAFDALPDRKKAEALRRVAALDAVDAMVATGEGRDMAMMMVARRENISLRTLYSWAAIVRYYERHQWAMLLAPKHQGRTAREDIPSEAWDYFRSLDLTPERRTVAHCYRLTVEAAAKQGWGKLPCRRTFARRIKTDVPATVRVLAREGVDALKRLYPAQRRDHSVFHALQAVNADGHKLDIFARWPDGTIGRPVIVAFQDIYSGLILSWRIDRTENTAVVLLAFGDMVEIYGIPDLVYLDNGRGFASKWMTGGAKTRFRFKIKESDPQGVFTLLGVETHWTTPYAGQSKPIERAFRDLATTVAKDPRFAGAYTGNTPDAKPDNYGAKAIDIAVVEKVLAEGIAEHNARLGRRSAVCAGKLSFEQAFRASYEASPIRRASAEQRRLWLLATEAVTVRQDATVHLAGNFYWSEQLVALRGSKVVLRFDPDAFHAGVHVYRTDGVYVTEAACVEAVGFADAAAARAHARARTEWLRAQRAMLAAERTLTIDQVARIASEAAPAPAEAPPAPAVVRPVFGATALKPDLAAVAAAEEEARVLQFRRGLMRLAE